MTETRLPFCSVEEAAEEIRQGRMIVLVDDEDRENEGDLTMAAEKITPDAINFMAKYGRGLICLTLTEQRCEELNLPLMSPINTSRPPYRFLRSHRCARRRHHGHQRLGPRHHHSHRHRPEDPSAGPGAPRTHVPVARSQWRRACTCWADRGFRRPIPHRGAESLWRDLRNHE